MWCVFGILIFSVAVTRIQSEIQISSNGYTGIIVAISPTIDEKEGGELLLKLQEAINSASHKLYEITNKRAYFKEIVFLIPSSWESESEWLPSEASVLTATEEKYKDAAVYVEEDGVFGRNPHTIQTGGCGEQGLRIHMTKEFLQTSHFGVTERANKIVFEWIKYRYGVFNEHGFPNDERYPDFYGVPGDSEAKVTSCLNQPTKIIGDLCLPRVDNKTGKVDMDCQPEIESLDGRISSFMYSPKLKILCGLDEEHDTNSPTKHNALCKEKSIWDVILQHEDFKNGRNSPSLQRGVSVNTTTFKYVRLRDVPVRMVLAIDRSKYVTEEKGDILQLAVTRFLKNFIPEKSLVGFIRFSDSETNFYEMDLRPAKDILKVEYIQSTESSPCLSCALSKSVELLEKESTSVGGIIVLLTTTELSSEDVTLLTNIITEKNVTVHIIKLYFSNTIPEEQQRIVSVNGGSIQELPQNYRNSKEEKIIQLYLALCRTVRDDIFGTSYDKVMIYQDAVGESENFFVNITFTVDSSIDNLMMLYTTSDSRKLVDDSLEFSTDNGTSLKRNHFKTAFDDIGKFITISEAEAGVYSFSIKRKPDYFEPVFFFVFAIDNAHLKALTARCWLNTNNQMVDPTKRPVIIYAEVRSGNKPVRNARVKVLLTLPDSNTVSFFLTDDGIGDPDVTRDDGIYSRYITEFTTPGYYTLSLLVVDDGKSEVLQTNNQDIRCCGSFVPIQSQITTGSFQRFYSYGNFYVLNTAGKDIFPPSRIVDLKITKIDSVFGGYNFSNWRIYFDFEFTSVGEDYNVGNASTYQMKYFINRKEVKSFQTSGFSLDDWEYHSKFQKLQYGTKQTLKIELQLNKLMEHHKPELNIFFAMRAADEDGNYGEVSNTVEAFIKLPDLPTTTTVVVTTVSNEKQQEQKQIVSKAGSGLSMLHIGLIIGIIGGLLIIVIAIIIIVMLKRRRKSKPKSSKKIDKKNIKIPSNEYLDGKKEPDVALGHLSPIQSWPANLLMDHYDKVQEAKQRNMATPIMKLQDVLDSSSMGSSKSLQSNVIYEDGFEKGNEYVPRLPTAPLSSSTNSLTRNPRHITEV